MDTGKEQRDTIKNKFIITWDNDKSFLIDDKATIDKFQHDWKGERSKHFYLCWYDYFLYLVEDNKIIDEIRVNEECKQVVCKHGVFDYPTPMLESLSRTKLISIARARFDSVSIGRRFIKDAGTYTDIYMPEGEYDEWIKYDGRVTITTKSGDSKKTQARIRKKILKNFPGADFLTQWTGGGRGYSLYHIYCNERLGKDLKGFKIEMKWALEEPGGILMISNSSSPIKDLIKKYSH
jgi:hypothetical protein